jgi:hypothetical protein
MDRSIYFSDLSKCSPSDSLDSHRKMGKWQVVPYESENVSGNMVFVGPHNTAPELTLKLNVTGHYRVYLGMNYGLVCNNLVGSSAFSPAWHYMIIKLTSDPSWRFVEPEKYIERKEGIWPEKAYGFSDLTEVYWRTAELTGQDVHFGPCRMDDAYKHTACTLAYVRLERLTDEEVRREEAEQPTSDTRRLIAVHDGFFHDNYPATKTFLEAYIEPLRNSDFEYVSWTTSWADACWYPTKIGNLACGDPLESTCPGTGPASLRKLIDSGVDPLAHVIEYAHAMGVKVLAQNRPAPTRIWPQDGPYCQNALWYEDPGTRLQTIDGKDTGHFSFASPRVVQCFTDLFREQLTNYDLDGIHVLFNRCYPFIGYETPVVEAFQAEHGQDPRHLPPDDPRWIQHKSRYMTAFIQGLRSLLDEIGTKKSKRLVLALHVMCCLDDNEYFGIDLRRWVPTNLVDILLVHPTFSPEIPNRNHHSVTPERVKEFMDLAKGTCCRIYPDVFPRRKPAEEFRKQAIGYYDVGADGLSFHDTYWRQTRPSEWAMIRKLGHRDDLKRWEGRGLDYFRKFKMLSVNGITYEPAGYGPGTCG